MEHKHSSLSTVAYSLAPVTLRVILVNVFILQIFRLSDLLSLWPGDKWTQHSKFKAIVRFLQTQAGMKARLDLVRAHQWLLRGDNTDQGMHQITPSC